MMQEQLFNSLELNLFFQEGLSSIKTQLWSFKNLTKEQRDAEIKKELMPKIKLELDKQDLTEGKLSIPFTGHEYLLYCFTNNSPKEKPNAQIDEDNGNIIILFDIYDNARNISQYLQKNINLIKQHIEEINENVEDYNNRLPRITQNYFEGKKGHETMVKDKLKDVKLPL